MVNELSNARNGTQKRFRCFELIITKGALKIMTWTKTIAAIVVGTAVILVTMAFAADSSSRDFISSGTEFVDLLVKEDFTGAVGRFDSTMKSALPEQKLREVWQSLQKQAGRFKKQLRTRMEMQQGYEAVFVTCQFERATLDAKVVFDAKKQIAGLFFVPSQAAAKSFTPPPYAKASAFHEKDFTVGTGEWRLPGTLTLPAGGTNPFPLWSSSTAQGQTIAMKLSWPTNRFATWPGDWPLRASLFCVTKNGPRNTAPSSSPQASASSL